jgi:hypothetical protein
VVEFVVAIDEARVRFTDDAQFFLLLLSPNNFFVNIFELSLVNVSLVVR